jgi:DNA polymerase III sliding clamp (beta) subunit (PCNA family)
MKGKQFLPKDSLNRIVKIMEYVEEYGEQLSEDNLKTTFGDIGYNLFSRYCLGGNKPYAQSHSGKLKLTQLGVRRLHELRKILAEERRAEWVKWATIIIAIFTVLQFLRWVWII